MNKNEKPRRFSCRSRRGKPLSTPEIVAESRELLRVGFALAALNALMENSTRAARQVMSPPEVADLPPPERCAKLVEAIGVAVARLHEARDALEDDVSGA
jgi:hypothetical protein